MIEIGITKDRRNPIVNNLAERRTLHKWSQRELSNISNVAQPIISDIENGKIKSPTVETAMKLAKALGCTVEDLFGGAQ